MSKNMAEWNKKKLEMRDEMVVEQPIYEHYDGLQAKMG